MNYRKVQTGPHCGCGLLPSSQSQCLSDSTTSSLSSIRIPTFFLDSFCICYNLSQKIEKERFFAEFTCDRNDCQFRVILDFWQDSAKFILKYNKLGIANVDYSSLVTHRLMQLLWFICIAVLCAFFYANNPAERVRRTTKLEINIQGVVSVWVSLWSLVTLCYFCE